MRRVWETSAGWRSLRGQRFGYCRGRVDVANAGPAWAAAMSARSHPDDPVAPGDRDERERALIIISESATFILPCFLRISTPPVRYSTSYSGSIPVQPYRYVNVMNDRSLPRVRGGDLKVVGNRGGAYSACGGW